MSVGPTGIPNSLAGSPLAQSRGSDVERTQQETSDQARRVGTEQRAQDAAGVGQTEQDEEASDRDADGRRPWELNPQDEGQTAEDGSDGSNSEEEQPRGRDAKKQSGTQIDLTG